MAAGQGKKAGVIAKNTPAALMCSYAAGRIGLDPLSIAQAEDPLRLE